MDKLVRKKLPAEIDLEILRQGGGMKFFNTKVGKNALKQTVLTTAQLKKIQAEQDLFNQFS